MAVASGGKGGGGGGGGVGGGGGGWKVAPSQKSPLKNTTEPKYVFERLGSFRYGVL